MCVSSAAGSSVFCVVVVEFPFRLLAKSPIVAKRIRKLPFPFSLTTADTDGTTVAATAAVTALSFSFNDRIVALRLPPLLILLSPGKIVFVLPVRCLSVMASIAFASASRFFLFRTMKYRTLYIK